MNKKSYTTPAHILRSHISNALSGKGHSLLSVFGCLEIAFKEVVCVWNKESNERPCLV
ncbi:hypothetical protein N9H37_00080 [Congregibacter sp.]|nr:hypothetical protein [Congregibacter sp.]MDA8961741.1 hypothetical protein [Congregibacter sp.]